MKVKKIVDQTLELVTSNMHAKRRSALLACVTSILDGNPVCVTRIGRGITNSAFEKHRIKRSDRLCSNLWLQSECSDIYQALITHYGHVSSTPILLVDWSDLDDRQDKFLLRASLAVEGRAITLYQEVHTLKTKDKPSTHKKFLMQLRRMFSDEVKPIIVTDAGFRCPLFKQVQEMGWDFVGRVRNRTQYQLEQELGWTPIKALYHQATKTPKLIGAATLAKANPTQVNLVLFRKTPKGRHNLTRKGTIAQWTNSKLTAKREREPWLLATSLKCSRTLAKRVVKIYHSRMQIEQTFRDTKNIYYGLGLSVNRTRDIGRLSVLLLLAAIASFILVILGLLAEDRNLHRQFQANTIKTKRVLSFHYLGLRVYQCEWIQFHHIDTLRVQKYIKILLENYTGSFDEEAFL